MAKTGVSILFKASLNVPVSKIIKDKEGRTLSLLCQIHEKHFVNVVCLYAPLTLSQEVSN